MKWHLHLATLILSLWSIDAKASSKDRTDSARQRDFDNSAHEIKRNPALVIQTLGARLKAPQEDRLTEIGDFALYAAALAELGDIDQLESMAPQLQSALDDALQAKSFAPALSLMLVQAYKLENLRQTEAAHARYEQVIQIAKEKNLPNYQLQALYEYSFALQDEGSLELGLQRQNEANQLVLARPDIDPLEKHIFWAQNAMSLHFSGSYPEAEQLYTQALAYFEEKNLDFLFATYLYNRGTLYAEWGHERALTAAENDFNRALSLAQKIHHEPLQGSILASLGSIYESQQKVDRGLEAAKKALQIFLKSQDKLWQANIYRLMAKLYVAAENWNEAEKATRQALLFYSESQGSDRSVLFHILAKVAAARGDYKTAYQELEQHRLLEKLKYKEKSSDTFAKERVRMGLLVEEQKNALLVKDNELKEQKIKASRWILTLATTVSILLLFTLVLLVKLAQTAKEVRRRKDRMDRILSNIEDAIITLDRQLRIEPEYSAFTETLLAERSRLEGLPGLDILQTSMGLSEHDRVMIEETLRTCLGEDALTWELNHGHLPIEANLPNRIVTLHWQAFYSKHKHITGYLLSMRDVTQRRHLEAQLKVAELESSMMHTKLKELLATDRQAADRLLRDIQEAISDANVTSTFKRRAHTMKGIARTLQLKSLAASLHQWEDGFSAEIGKILLQECTQYQNILKDMRGSSSEASAGLLQSTSSLAMELKKHLEQHSALTLHLEVIDSIIDWPVPLASDLQTILLHACTNAIDHGFLRAKHLPSTAAQLRIEAHRQGDDFTLTIQDNGRGIGWDQLKSLAASKGFIPGPGQSVADVVFLDQVSTADTVSATSGRGVGLAAVKEIVDRWGGLIQLQDHPAGAGSQLFIRCPWPSTQLDHAI